MLLGIITDVHEQLEPLRIALRLFEREGVEQIVFAGDFVACGQHIEATAQMLLDAGVVGVWGNHDFGFCDNPPADFRAEYPPVVFDFAARLKPRLQIEDCHFSHVEPWLDTTALEQLWYFDGFPTTREQTARTFAADIFPPDFNAHAARVMFFGHMHRYFAATPDTILEWQGDTRVHLRAPQRYLVCIAALCDARCATYDTSTGMLTPFDLSRQH